MYDDRQLFEFLCLEGAQAGLSWITILKKKENYELAFDHFDPEKIAAYGEQEIERLMNDSGIVRNRLKIKAFIANSKSYLQIKEEFLSFSDYIWSFVDHKPVVNHWISSSSVPVRTEISDRMSKDLKKQGFLFVGSTICYAYMQAVGMVMDHTVDCFRYDDLQVENVKSLKGRY